MLEKALNEVKKLQYDPRLLDVRIGQCKESLDEVYATIDRRAKDDEDQGMSAVFSFAGGTTKSPTSMNVDLINSLTLMNIYVVVLVS